MAETLQKLRPDRDLQCYFQQPSAVAALSETKADGFVVSGSWRQQFDWAVIEWSRDNTFEHPAFRYLPDGDLSGLELTYEETRENCIPMDCDLWPTVEWPYLRIWTEGAALPRLVKLLDYATPIGGAATAASVEFELGGTATAGDYVGLAWLTEQYNYCLNPSDSIESAVGWLAQIINAAPAATMTAEAAGRRIRLTAKTAGANWNRVGVYGFVSDARTEHWSPWWGICGGGSSPTKWRVHLDFDNLRDKDGAAIPVAEMRNVRKMRWTYAAGWQDGEFARSEFAVRVSNWTVTGTGREYRVAGPASRRIEDDGTGIVYSPAGAWTAVKGPYNYSGGSYHLAAAVGARMVCTYRASGVHSLYLGTQKVDGGAQVCVTVDGAAAGTFNLRLALEDPRVRIPLGECGAGMHTVAVEVVEEGRFYFDFLELAVPSATLPAIQPDAKMSLATDWDTEHSICLAPERTAWMIDSLGFRGRVNHYVGALWFYELARVGHEYASAQIEFVGTPEFGGDPPRTEISFARAEAPNEKTVLTHVHYAGDTAETVAKAFEMEINRGSSSVRARAVGAVLTVWSRTMGADGNHVLIEATPAAGAYRAVVSGPALSGGKDGAWRTDLQATPRLNRAARDWSRSFFAALKARGLDAVAALSMELRDADPSVETGIAQRCPAGDAVVVSTPAVQTNFSPVSVAFWREAYRDLARTMADAGMRPYLQFGEVQWWYFRDARSGMPFYDAYTQDSFQAVYGRPMRVIGNELASPADFPEEAEFLPTLIGAFTNAVMAYVRETFPECRFEVLYPLDVNEGALNRAVNYPAADWTPAVLDCLKTESFNYTYSRNLNKCMESITAPFARGFPRAKSAHLVGISDPTTPWEKEARMARGEGVESVVLFALDQFCLVGHGAPLDAGARRSLFQG